MKFISLLALPLVILPSNFFVDCMPLDQATFAEVESQVFNDSVDQPSTMDGYVLANRGPHEHNLLIQRGTPVMNEEMTLASTEGYVLPDRKAHESNMLIQRGTPV